MTIILRSYLQLTIDKFNNNKCEKVKKKLYQSSLYGLAASSRCGNCAIFYEHVFKLPPETCLNMSLHFVMNSCSLSYEFILDIVKIIECVLSLRSSQ